MKAIRERDVLMNAIREDDLEKVKRLIAEGADVKEANEKGHTALLEATLFGRIPIMHWLLTEGGSSLAEETEHGTRALSLAAFNGQFPAMQYLLKERGASLSEGDSFGNTVWDCIDYGHKMLDSFSSADLSSMLKFLVMLEDAPADFIAKLSPNHATICTRGRRFRLQPPYLEQQRAKVIAHCPLPTVLQSLVAEYAATTSKDMWTDGLRVQVSLVKRARTKNATEVGEAEGEDAPPLRRSLRLRKKR
jgi:hypothetical protein